MVNILLYVTVLLQAFDRVDKDGEVPKLSCDCDMTRDCGLFGFWGCIVPRIYSSEGKPYFLSNCLPIRWGNAEETAGRNGGERFQNGSERFRGCTEWFWSLFAFLCRAVLGHYRLGRNLT